MKYPDFLLRKSGNAALGESPFPPAPGVMRRRLLVAGGIFFALVVAAYVVLGGGQPEKVATSEADRIFTSAYSSRVAAYDRFVGAAARPMAACKGTALVDCVDDGDTFWLSGDRIRLANVDAPELASPCANHARLAGEAQRTLLRLLDRKPIDIFAQGRDHDGRLLAYIKTPDGDVGRELLRWRVAEPWKWPEPTRDAWCD